MNRRIFLKTTGIISLLGITNISLGQKEQKWINMGEIRPEIGQRCIINKNNYYIFVGIIEEYKGETFVSISAECYYNISKNKNHISFAMCGKDGDRKLDKFIREQWIDGEIKDMSYRMYSIVSYGFNIVNTSDLKTWWVPIDNNYNIPKNLPLKERRK